jgi:hypothetical protein
MLESLRHVIANKLPHEPFRAWSEDDFPNINNEFKTLMSRMTNLDHGKRASMSNIITDPYWDRT